MDIITPHISCVVAESELQEALDQKYGEIYVLSGNGIFKHMRLKGNRHVRFKVDAIPNYKSALTEEMNFLPAGKIPYAMFEQLIDFFKSVMQVKKLDLEAMAHILWSPEEGYHIAVPNQTIGKASVNYDWEGYMKPNDIIVLDIHSHNTMGAFFSGTDNNDDKTKFCYSAVVGELNKPNYATVWRFNANEYKRTTTIDEIFEIPHKEISVNQEWLDKIKPGNTHVVPFMSPTRNIGSNGHYVGRHQERFPGFESEDEMTFWQHRAIQAEQEANSGQSPKVGTVQKLQSHQETSAWKDYLSSKEKVGDVVKKQRGKDTSPGEDDYVLAQYGEDLLDSKQSAEAWIDDLEESDELLLFIILYAYDKLSEAGQAKLMTEGL